MKRRNLKLLISDIGDVYIIWHGVIGKICQAYGLPKQEFTDWYLKDFATMLYEGILPIDEFWKTVDITYHVHVTGDPFTLFFEGKPIVGMEALFKNLKQSGLRIVSASNTYAPNWDVCFDKADMSVFSSHYPSHLLHLAKPHPEYFLYILKHEAVNPDECLFIDDRTENIQGAEALGINTYRYIYEEDPDAIVLGQFIRNNYTLVS